jgi:signal transduction histidine kinase
MTARAVPWVAPVFYGAVLLVGVLTSDGPGWSLAGFALGSIVLLALELLERRLPPSSRTATAMLAARVVVTAGVILLDRAQIAQVLIVLIPFQAYFTLGRRVSLSLAGGFLAAAPVVLEVTEPGWRRDTEQVGDLLMLTLGLVMAVTMAAVAVEAHAGRARLEAAQHEVAELTASAERARLARDIHDTVGHHLTAIAVQLEKSAAFRDLDRDASDRALTDARQSARLALADVRGAVRALRETPGPVSLAGLLDELTARLSGSGPRVDAEVVGAQDGWDTEALTALFRVAQEGLTNAVRHARAQRVTVRVCFRADDAVLAITDDGIGMTTDGGSTPGHPVHRPADPPEVESLGPRPGGGAERGSGYGLIGIRERVQALDGRLDVRSAPGAGTTLTVRVPRSGVSA